jgi:hypothetical protein
LSGNIVNEDGEIEGLGVTEEMKHDRSLMMSSEDLLDERGLGKVEMLHKKEIQVIIQKRVVIFQSTCLIFFFQQILCILIFF